MFQKILIANRGEIAVRVIRAARELGVATVAVYSEADRESLHVKLADEAVCIGPPKSADSYLAIPRILAAADITKAEAIHPGYGFLSEKAHFAEACESSGFRFIGPPAEAIRVMGDKSVAKSTMKRAGVPTLPGSEGVVESIEQGVALAEATGYPVILKAKDGGGGKGMRVVRDAAELARAFPMAQAEAAAAFSSSALYLEKFLERPRHVEIQILADAHGQVVHLYERDCSVQRRHQKLIEEAPAPGLDPKIRAQMGETACRGAAEIGYRGVGTMEFLLDEDGSFYFMEMNTRLQVEHPVTEMILGLDLVKLQLRVAAGEPIPFTQDDVRPAGHAIECRINAEAPELGFRPSPGRIESLHFAGGPGVRVDSHIYAGYVIPPHYDSMIGKIITHGCDRAEAIERMRRALHETRIEGIATTLAFQHRMLSHPRFRRGGVDTHFLESMQLEGSDAVNTSGASAATANG